MCTYVYMHGGHPTFTLAYTCATSTYIHKLQQQAHTHTHTQVYVADLSSSKIPHTTHGIHIHACSKHACPKAHST